MKIGSITKPMVATALFELLRSGDLRLDQSVGSIVPWLDRRLMGATVGDLVTHMAGLRPDWLLRTSSTEEYLQHICVDSPYLRPGTTFSYANAGYVLLGHVLELVAGGSLPAIVKEFVWRPLGMAQTRFAWSEPPEGASGHARALVTASPEPQTPTANVVTRAAGSMTWSTAGDLLTFAHAHVKRAERADHDVSDHRMMTMRRIDVADPTLADAWGYGWSLYRCSKRFLFGHVGHVDGFTSVLIADDREGLAFVLLVNESSDAAQSLQDCFIHQVVMPLAGGERRSRPVPVGTATGSAVEGIEGSYYQPGSIIRFRRAGADLRADVAPLDDASVIAEPMADLHVYVTQHARLLLLELPSGELRVVVPGRRRAGRVGSLHFLAQAFVRLDSLATGTAST